MSISRGSEWRQWDLHVHTASSYDYKYNAADADDLLVQAWKENDIKVVAITDHFLIDAERIQHLRDLAGDEVVIFPGVELRTDKGSTNIHLIAIFPEESSLNELQQNFEVIMLGEKAKAKENPESIYWDFADIVDFTRRRKGILTLHTGSKPSGLDEKISNNDFFKMAVKDEYAENIPIFEVLSDEDVIKYNDKILPYIGIRPVIICSDNHDPRNYNRKEKLWIKADCTFEGLIQVINQPEERVFIGTIPPKVDKAEKRSSVYIDSVTIRKDEDAKNTDSNWFDIEMPINKGLTVVIGNKGSGKSGFADIIGHLCDSNSMKEASFLNVDRFRKGPERYADDYSGQLKWLDGKETDKKKLSAMEKSSEIQYAQYLPQKFIERICTDLEREFQEEINKVIFSYVDGTVKGEAADLNNLILMKSHPHISKIKSIQSEISSLNSEIIELESKITTQYKEQNLNGLKKAQEMLDRHITLEPREVVKPENTISEEEQRKLDECECRIEEINSKIELIRTNLTAANKDLSVLSNSVSDIDRIINEVEILNSKLQVVKEKFFKDGNFDVAIETPKDIILSKTEEIKEFIFMAEELLGVSGDSSKSLYTELEKEKEIKEKIISKADASLKTYQKYLEDRKEWVETRDKLIGNETTLDTVKYYELELNRIENDYLSIYENKKLYRIEKVKEIIREKNKIIEVYSQIYLPIEKEICEILEDMTEKIDFKASVVLADNEIGTKLLKFINHTYAGVFNGTTKANNKMREFIRDTNFSDQESILMFIDNVMKAVEENIDKSSEIVRNKQEFYDSLYGLDYINVEFNLNYAERDLMELSPGERGIVLLIFYLALNKGEEPLIIDQPEDNLDNESVYLKLVPCIQEAKKRRQVIIVTHNPNIAVACDAEQVIYCKIDKSKNEITYSAGSIENNEIRQHIIDVLEGTKPAFELRSRKYVF